jgi:DNA-binding LacI/PurR family transcriptional regulator
MHSFVALYMKIAKDLESRRRNLKTPLALPTEEKLAVEYETSRETIRRALLHLENQGAVTRKRKLGTYLQPTRPEPAKLRNKHIAVILPDWADVPGSWYVSTIYEGVRKWAEEHDCKFCILYMDTAASNHENAWLDKLRKLHLDGTIWIHPLGWQHKLLRITSKLFPTAVMGRTVLGGELHHVVPDYDLAAELIDGHLGKFGHERYAIIGKHLMDPFSMSWLSSFQKAHERRGIPFNAPIHSFDVRCFREEDLPQILLKYYLPYHPEIQALVFPAGQPSQFLRDREFREKVTEGAISIVTTNYSLFPIESALPGTTIAHIRFDWQAMAWKTMNTLAMVAEGHPVPEITREPVTLIPGDTVHVFRPSEKHEPTSPGP